MLAPNKPLVGSVFERTPRSSVSSPSTPRTNASTTGFPIAQHRLKSARNQEAEQSADVLLSRAAVPPVVQRVTRTQKQEPLEEQPDIDEWRVRMSEENERRVAAMADEEREEERREIEEKFGKNIGDVLKRARMAREAHKMQKKAMASLEGDTSDGTVLPSVPPVRTTLTVEPPLGPPSPILSGASTRSSTPTRANRKLRFADVTPADVHVYESAPPSPRRKPLALLPPSGEDITVCPAPGSIKPVNVSGLQLGVVTPKADTSAAPSSITSDGPPGTGTPEDIRRRFFPSFSAGDPSLAWIESMPLPDPTAPTLRFDLHGAPIPPELSISLPTHLGLHHHAEGARAGYTIDDIFLLTRSTVPAQRVAMLGIVAGIIRRLAGMRQDKSGDAKGMEELRGKEEGVRKRAIAAGAEAMTERGSLGSKAVEVLWEAIVRWDEELMSSDGAELQDKLQDNPPEVPVDQEGEGSSKADFISSLQLWIFLPRIATVLSAVDLPHLSLVQLLAILQRLAMHSNAIADEISATPSLVASIFRVFILTPIPPSDNSPLPEPAAIHLLTTLASASRASASRLIDPTDTLLRFLTPTPASSPYPLPLATNLLIQTLRLYTTFARYGLYAHIATTAAEPLSHLSSYILAPECDSRPLLSSYLSLIAAWMVCASDPHQTTPPHDILWSQVSGWGWISDLATIAHKLTQDTSDWGTWAALWNMEAAWLEGARHNGVRGGVGERETSMARLRPAFDGKIEEEVVLGAISSLKRLLSEIPSGYDPNRGLTFYREMAESALVLCAVIRLWLVCLPLDNESLPEPSFQLPLSLLGMLATHVVTHPLLSESSNVPPRSRAFLRPLVSFIANYVWLLRRLPGTSRGLWLAQLGATIIRLLPGDEDTARDMLDAIINSVDEQCLIDCGWSVPSDVWSRGGLGILMPFFAYELSPRVDDVEGQDEETRPVHVAPLFPTPQSLKLATTQRLPSTRGFTLLFTRDWPLLPLDGLLRSGTSPVWRHLPSDWDASEADVVRASLILTRIVREAMLANGIPFAMTRAEVTFGCMKVFMLEHGQAQGATSASGEGREEVFRDSVVAELMEALLLPLTLGASTNGLSALSSTDDQDNLEVAAARFLGSGTPFFQFYTDFVTLYDATSFGHPLFAALLLPPLAQRYASDYRKLLYDDTAHVLGTVRTPPERVIGESAGAFLWPAEQAPQIVGAMLSLLVGRRARVSIEGFVRWMAVHHVAANVWPDLRENPSSIIADERARKLFEALVIQGEHSVVQEVGMYWQRRTGHVVLPPLCFDLEPERRQSRLSWVKGWAKGELFERMEGLFGIRD